MTDNLRIWNAVSKTDPAHTKKVEFGRKFTSIDAHWQIQQATKQFGPVGEGWGYKPVHSVERLTDQMILAVADVTIWWLDRAGNGTLGSTHEYGPIRATCEMYGPKTYKGKIIPGEFVTDEDAPKKAMTDALTKGLSHLGFSADVFLGLFDDNRYVQKMEKEFSAGGIEGRMPPNETVGKFPPDGPRQSSANGRRMAAEESQLIDNTRLKGGATKPAVKPKTLTPAEERAAKITAATDKRIEALRAVSAWTRETLDQFWTDNKVWIDWMADPEHNALAEYERFTTAFADAEINIRETL